MLLWVYNFFFKRSIKCFEYFFFLKEEGIVFKDISLGEVCGFNFFYYLFLIIKWVMLVLEFGIF